MPVGTAPAALQLITPNRMRAQVSAFFMLALNLLTATIAPFGIGLANDYLFTDADGIGLSIVMVATIPVPIAALLLWQARRSFSELSDSDE